MIACTFAASPDPLRELIRVAGARWAIEECLQTAKNEAGLDQYQVRSWRAWYAHITLAVLAAVYLAATRATEQAHDRGKGISDRSRRLIPLTANEVRRLLTALALTPLICLDHVLHWSDWRRERQHHPPAEW